VLAFDENRKNTLNELFKILIIGILVISGLAISASFFFSRIAISPISRINSDVKKINSQKLSSRLETGSGKDEIEQLATTFNQMLTDIELAFKSQDDFVKNTSHELRTPLAVMIAETDYLLSKTRENEEYEKHLSRLSADLHKINALISNLLELAQMNRDNSFSKTLVRADEVVFSAIQSVKTKYPARKIVPKIDYTENDKDLLIEGNSGLLEMAIKNLIENACKFSDDQVEIRIELVPEILKIKISDSGIGIPEADIQHIFKPFNRASNSRYISGFGIGLSIVEKIVLLHQGEIKVYSTENEGSTFELIFNHV
jgi:signal transduction histidine kinase